MATARAHDADRRPARSRFATSKFLAPALPGHHVPRPALRDFLDRESHPLRLVVGSPGSGKTTLLAEWYHAAASPKCWLNVDDGDLNPARFWRGFIAAVQTVAPRYGADCLDLLHLDDRVDPDVLECLLLGGEQLAQPVRVVVDDFHLSGDEVAQQLRFLLTRDLGALRLTVGTRAEPEIGLHRLRLEDKVTEVRERDLRFASVDAAHLIQALGVRLSAQGLRLVVHRTEGWAAGLQLAALALHKSDNPTALVERITGTDQVIGQYLWSEVFTAQSPAVQRFLIDTCVVDELTPTLANALSPDNPVTLLDLEAAHLLLRRVDEEGHAFRFHQLLTDMLRFRLRATDAQHEAVLHERAAGWYESNDKPLSAFRHRWRAGQRTDALQIVHGTVLDVIYDLPTMPEFERSLTDDDIRAAPGPAISFAVALVTGGFVIEAERLTRRITAATDGHLDAGDEEQLVAVQAIAAIVLGDSRAAARFGASVEAGSSQRGAWSILTRLAAAKGLIWEGELEAAEAQLDEAASTHASALERMELAGTLAMVQLWRGDLRACGATARACLNDLRRGSHGALTDGLLARSLLGTVMLEQGETEPAERMLPSVSEMTSSFRVPAVVLTKLAMSRLRAAEGRLEAAMVSITDCYQLIKARPTRNGMVDQVRTRHVKVLLDAGEFDEAAAVIGEIGSPSRRVLLAAELDIAQMRLDSARRHLDDLNASRAGTRRWELELALIRLKLAVATGAGVEDAAGSVLDVSGTEAFVFPVAEAGGLVLGAVQSLARRRPRDRYTETLMRLRPRAQSRTLITGKGRDVLTDRERVVLRYMATSMSYREVAGELVVSLNTLKTHVKNINRKLQATSRSEAIRRAHELSYL
jgi:LuxR family maltose regulon positive regulatory protein